MKTRPKFRVTTRVLRGLHWYHDEARCRFVVYRRAGGLSRRTSVRYSEGNKGAARREAEQLAARLVAHPAEKLADFVF